MRKRKDKTKHKYLIGFIGDKQCVYGKDVFCKTYDASVASFTQPMTLFQAERQLKQLNGQKTIYELKPIRTKARTRKAKQ